MYNSLALDSNDCPHISYCDATSGDLKYARWTGSGWEIEVVDSEGDVGKYTSIAVAHRCPKSSDVTFHFPLTADKIFKC